MYRDWIHEADMVCSEGLQGVELESWLFSRGIAPNRLLEILDEETPRIHTFR